jgi:hypothetical protein
MRKQSSYPCPSAAQNEFFRILLKPNQVQIVQIEPIEGETEESASAWIAANAVDSDPLPTDLADRHDHYLFGRPKKDTRG